MKKTLHLRREPLAELATPDLHAVRGAAVPTPALTVGPCGDVLRAVRTVTGVTTTITPFTDVC